MAMLGNVFGCFRWGVLLGVSLLVAGPASAAYETPYWDVQRTNGVVYGQGRVANGASWKDLELDLYEPIGNPDQKKPAIVLIHGGGFTGGSRGGMSWGATDELGYHAVDNVFHVHDLHATMLHLLGIDHERLTYRFQGRDFRLTDVHGRVVKPLLA